MITWKSVCLNIGIRNSINRSLDAANQSKEPEMLKGALKGKFFIGTAMNVRQIWERDTADVKMKSHISTVVRCYTGRIHGWDAVNEAILEDDS